MIALRTEIKKGKSRRLGYFRSYRDIGEFFARHGETGVYYAIPLNVKSLVAIKKINVKKYWDEDLNQWEREIEMEGSYF